MKKDWRREYFSIPNIMSYFRLLLIPIYLLLYFSADDESGYGYAAAVIAVSGLTDMLDGKIARHYNMITEWGKFIDPVADKLTLAAIALSMAFRYPLMGVMFGLYVVKELYMFCMGAYMLKRGFRMDGAQWYGKVCTAVTYGAVFLLLVIPGMPKPVSDGLIGLCLFVTLAAFLLQSLEGPEQIKVPPVPVKGRNRGMFLRIQGFSHPPGLEVPQRRRWAGKKRWLRRECQDRPVRRWPS